MCTNNKNSVSNIVPRSWGHFGPTTRIQSGWAKYTKHRNYSEFVFFFRSWRIWMCRVPLGYGRCEEGRLGDRHPVANPLCSHLVRCSSSTSILLNCGTCVGEFLVGLPSVRILRSPSPTKSNVPFVIVSCVHMCITLAADHVMVFKYIIIVVLLLIHYGMLCGTQ